ncbi:MAG: lipopolysaccharide assembly protein LapA domain-containing protein [Acidobacteriota bacterium]
MRFIKFILLVLFFLVFMIFFVQNQAQLSSALELKFNLFTLNWQAQPLPFYLVVLIFFVLGALFSTIFFVIDRIRVGSICREAQSKAQSLQSEVDALKAKQTTIPATTSFSAPTAAAPAAPQEEPKA